MRKALKTVESGIVFSVGNMFKINETSIMLSCITKECKYIKLK